MAVTLMIWDRLVTRIEILEVLQRPAILEAGEQYRMDLDAGHRAATRE